MRYIICALPRSRTFWLSVVLSYEGEVCLHDPIGKFGIELPQSDGISDTGAWLVYPELCGRYPKAKWIVVWREPKEVKESLSKKGIAPITIDMGAEMLAGIKDKAYLTIPYRELDAYGPVLWEAAGISADYPKKYWNKMKLINLQET